MKKLLIAFLLSGTSLFAQDFTIPKNRIPVQQDGFLAWVQVYEGKIKSSALSGKKMYAWLKARQIHTSRGDFAGELLHGDFLALYKSDALKEKGKYNKGLKTGTWKEWHPNGELKWVSHWQNGLQHGTSVYYNETGKMTRHEHFKSGRLQGKQIIYSDSTETALRYKKGKLILPKQKNRRTQIKATIPVMQDSAQVEPGKKKRGFLFQKKNKMEAVPERKKERHNRQETKKTKQTEITLPEKKEAGQESKTEKS